MAFTVSTMTVVRIHKSKLRKGMFVESVECPDYAFNRRRFFLDLDEDLEAILVTPADFVVVNTALGKTTGIAGGEPGSRREIDEVRFRKAAETLSRSTIAVKAGFASFISGEQKTIQDFVPVSRELTQQMAEGPAVMLEMTRLKTKDEGTFVHSIAVAALMTSVGRAVGFDEETVEMLGVAGILHDCGKLLIPNMILNKQGTLSDIERRIVRNHPELGYQRLLGYPGIPEMVLDVCRYHHEMLDGSGYPLGLRGDALSLYVRISTVCDVYDALTSVRPYKKAWSGRQAISWMFEQGERFDRKLLLNLGEVAFSE